MFFYSSRAIIDADAYIFIPCMPFLLKLSRLAFGVARHATTMTNYVYITSSRLCEWTGKLRRRSAMLQSYIYNGGEDTPKKLQFVVCEKQIFARC